jgi:hypothetical protein
MSLKDTKEEVFGKIAALRVSNEGFPSINLKNSFDSINESANPIDFIIDVLKSVKGSSGDIKSTLIDILTFKIDDIEKTIKENLKLKIREYGLCGISPSIPDYIKHHTIVPQSTGVDLELDKLDFFKLFFINPTSDNGKLLYFDNNSSTNSEDLNVVLFETVQNDNVEVNWGSQTTDNDIFSFVFKSSTTNGNNILNVKVSQFYSDPSNNKTFVDLISDYIDSIKLFNTTNIITGVFDSLFGTISSAIDKSISLLEKETEFEIIIERIINSIDEEEIDDSYFSFSNDLGYINEIATNKRKGITKFLTCTEEEKSVVNDKIIEMNDGILNSSSKVEVKEVLKNTFDSVVSDFSTNGDVNKDAKEVHFFTEFFKKLSLILTKGIFTPKIYFILLFVSNVVLNKQNETPIEWIKNNRELIRNILKEIREYIIDIILKEILKELKKLIVKHSLKLLEEKVLNRKLQMSSLSGLPPNVLRAIKDLK